MRQGRYPFIVGFLAAPVLLYVVFVVSPYIQAFYIALTDWKGISANPRFIGLENFARLLDDEVFWAAVRHHGVLLLVMPLVTIVIALFFSFLLNLSGGQRGGRMTGIRGSKVYRVIFFMPQVLAVAIVGVLFQAIYSPERVGVVNGLLDKIGVEPVGWLIDPDLALWTIISVMVWQAVGFYVVLFSAGMSSIPKDVFEAAALDGAGRFTLFFKITIPLLWDTMQVAWVYLGIAAFDAFALVQVLSVDRGGPDNATTVLPMEIWRTAFNFSKFGYASAMGVALFFMTITFAALTLRVTRRERIEF
ncbi:sugar ABC transporter permease [Streptosporangium sp. NBC_01755]|uniref:carbohydrate ABC transporter permease n=1 Tax=unclassified Streptosporangium TaxID=2632669 RepID=UPI002DDA6469|nr:MULTISPECIES: sugar ABC transporter permease [unclassified Streptosporangium]WSA26857.1 sugar ABC transporter permease [Streptosporangium sp. NBC_01810]WSD01718.1 sugar ABC transporter permease [Streptosporangium sp. NBC_01755]